MKTLFDIELTDEEFNLLICEQNKGKELKVVNGKVVAVEPVETEQERIQSRIAELKQLLANTDYQAIKYAEGLISVEDYEPIKAQRQQWRNEINALEQQLNK